MKQQKVYIFDDICIGVSNCDNEEEAREVIKKQRPELFSEITKAKGITYIRFGWFTETDNEDDSCIYCQFYQTNKVGRGAIKVFGFYIYL